MLFFDDFVGAAGNIDGRVTDALTWADASGDWELDGAGNLTVVGGFCTAQVPAYDDAMTVRVTQSPSTGFFLWGTAGGTLMPGQAYQGCQVEIDFSAATAKLVGTYGQSSAVALGALPWEMKMVAPVGTLAPQLYLNNVLVLTWGSTAFDWAAGSVDASTKCFVAINSSAPTGPALQIDSLRTGAAPANPSAFWTDFQHTYEVV